MKKIKTILISLGFVGTFIIGGVITTNGQIKSEVATTTPVVITLEQERLISKFQQAIKYNEMAIEQSDKIPNVPEFKDLIAMPTDIERIEAIKNYAINTRLKDLQELKANHLIIIQRIDQEILDINKALEDWK